MNSAHNPSSREFFEQMYTHDIDPWNFASDPYESSRYDAIVHCLSGKRFARAFEPGCSVGVLTARLALFCDHLLATDLSETAVARAMQRCAAYTNVHFLTASVADIDPGALDLLVLSEIGYYFNTLDLTRWAGRLLSRVRLGGTILTCHWRGVSSDHLLSGDQVQEVFQHLAADRSYVLTAARCTENYKLQSWTSE